MSVSSKFSTLYKFIEFLRNEIEVDELFKFLTDANESDAVTGFTFFCEVNKEQIVNDLPLSQPYIMISDKRFDIIISDKKQEIVYTQLLPVACVFDIEIYHMRTAKLLAPLRDNPQFFDSIMPIVSDHSKPTADMAKEVINLIFLETHTG